MKSSRFEEGFDAEQRRIYERYRDEKIEEALRDGVRWLTLPLPNGGVERSDLWAS